MKRALPFFLITLLAASFTVTAQPTPSPDEEAFFAKAMSQINVKHIRWINITAKEMNEKNLSPEDIAGKAQSYGILGNISEMDIEAMAFLVLMQAAKSAQEDLKAIMARVKSVNDQKAKQREMLDKMKQQHTMTAVQLDSFKLLKNRTIALQKNLNPDTVKMVRTKTGMRPVSKAETDNMIDQIKNDLDSMSEMGEMESLRLQMAMDRMSKMMSTLSNILKKIGKTQEEIIKNLK